MSITQAAAGLSGLRIRQANHTNTRLLFLFVKIVLKKEKLGQNKLIETK